MTNKDNDFIQDATGISYCVNYHLVKICEIRNLGTTYCP